MEAPLRRFLGFDPDGPAAPPVVAVHVPTPAPYLREVTHQTLDAALASNPKLVMLMAMRAIFRTMGSFAAVQSAAKEMERKLAVLPEFRHKMQEQGWIVGKAEDHDL